MRVWFLFLCIILLFNSRGFAQNNDDVDTCKVQNRVFPDGSLYFYIEPVSFYSSPEKKLKGGVTTDKENYFISLRPFPFPDKKEGVKYKQDLQLTLSNDTTYTIPYFSTRYSTKDSTLILAYLIKDKTILKKLLKHDVVKAVIYMGSTEGNRVYNFSMNQHVIREQLKCLIHYK